MLTYNTQTQSIHLTDALVFSTVTEYWKAIQIVFHTHAVDALDLKEVEKVDSAGLALLLACVRLQQQHSKTLRFLHLPTSLVAFAKACEVRELFS